MGECEGIHQQGEGRKWRRTRVTAVCILLLIVISIAVPALFHVTADGPAGTPCHEHLSVSLANPTFYPNGSAEDDGNLYPPGYHFSSNGSTRGCLCSLRPCIRKCCGKDERFIRVPGKRSQCGKHDGHSPFDNFSLPVYTSSGEFVQVDRNHFRFLYGDVCRHGMFVLDPKKFPEDKHNLMVDGRFRHVNGEHLDVSGYCVESTNGSNNVQTFVCFPDPTVDTESKVRFVLYPIAMIITMPFLLATVIVYAVLPSLRNTHGKSLMCQCTSLLVTYIGLTVIQLSAKWINNFWCVFTAFLVQYTFLASFFWLSVMSFDIWWRVSGLRPHEWQGRETEHHNFMLYSLYAWGVPLIIVAVSVAVDLIPSIPDSYIKPGFGRKSCWFNDKVGSVVYFYLPTGTVLLLNVFMFVTTAFKLQAYTKNGRDKDRFHLYLKLFLIMGISWIFELVSFTVDGPKYLWFVTDTVNILQGVVIFFIAVCRREILQKLNKKLCPSWNLIGRISAEHSKSLSSSFSKTEHVEVLDLKTLDCTNNGK